MRERQDPTREGNKPFVTRRFTTCGGFFPHLCPIDRCAICQWVDERYSAVIWRNGDARPKGENFIENVDKW